MAALARHLAFTVSSAQHALRKETMGQDGHAGQPEATRIAVDLPQDFCGVASLGLRYPDSIQAADNGAGAVPFWTCLHTISVPLAPDGRALCLVV